MKFIITFLLLGTWITNEWVIVDWRVRLLLNELLTSKEIGFTSLSHSKSKSYLLKILMIEMRWVHPQRGKFRLAHYLAHALNWFSAWHFLNLCKLLLVCHYLICIILPSKLFNTLIDSSFLLTIRSFGILPLLFIIDYYSVLEMILILLKPEHTVSLIHAKCWWVFNVWCLWLVIEFSSFVKFSCLWVLTCFLKCRLVLV